MEIIIQFNDLVAERQAFEIQIYDFLVDPIIPDDFWEPVKIGLTPEQISKIITEPQTMVESPTTVECFICTEYTSDIHQIICCKNTMCMDCINKWFSESVKCPYCMQDLRNCLKNE